VDKRRFARITLAEPVEAELAGLAAQIVNIGEGGVLIVSQTSYPIGSIHRLTILLPGGPLAAWVRVVGGVALGERGYAMNAAFVGLTKQDQATILTWMKGAESQGRAN
jgi:PilZ domain